MGGRIWVESEPGSGSTFHFSVRFGLADTSGAVFPEARREALSAVSVLVVDDNQTNRAALVEILSRWGMRPIAVASGESALEAIESARQGNHVFQLVITDMQMPKMHGLELISKLRQRPDCRDVPIILLSSGVQLDEAPHARELAIAAHLTKPVQPAELLDAMSAAITGTRASAPDAEKQQSLPQSVRSLKIVLAEDNAVNRKLAIALLEKHGHTVYSAENGRETLAVLDRERAGIVLMDLQMPVMDGFEAIRAIRAKERRSGGHLPIVALTAHAMQGDRERSLEAGADDYVTKPIRTGDLFAAI